MPVVNDGRGQIVCHLKGGPIALPRCREFQQETKDRGRSCTCLAYTAYAEGRQDPSVGPVPDTERMCGRAIAPEQLVRAAAIKRGAPLPKVARVTTGKPRAPQRCTRCRKLPPDGTHVWGGLCRPCRDVARTCAQCRAVKQRPALIRDGLCARCAPRGLQQELPIIADMVIANLQKANADKDAQIASLGRELRKSESTLRSIKAELARYRKRREKVQ
jgi:hypothetical protein